LFLQAEARFRGWITSGPTAFELFRSAVVDNFRFVGVPGDHLAAFNTMVANNANYPDVDYNTPAGAQGPGYPGGGLYTIIAQKWFALNGINTLEIWTDYRRLSYADFATYPGAPTDHMVYGEAATYPAGPTISVAPQNTATKIPVRYLYPQTEYNYNSANVSAEGTIDRYTRIFWDIN
jgi:hypothetical protein